MQKSISVVTVFCASFAVAACIVQQDPTYPQPAPQGPAPAGQPAQAPAPQSPQDNLQSLPNGDYSCSFRSGGYSYPPYTCVVFVGADGRQHLQKVRGSQRIRGTVQRNADGFDFQGTFYCPYGQCTQATSASFRAYDDGLFKGTLSPGNVEVTLQFQPGGFGGADYGYGGARYGGARYGGTLSVPRSY